MVQRCAQAPVIVVFKRDEAERLKYAVRELLHGGENLGHAVHRTRLRLECDFHEVTPP